MMKTWMKTFFIAFSESFMYVPEGRKSPPPLPSLPCWDEVNSLCPCVGGGGGEGRGGPLEGVGPENLIRLQTYSTEYRIQNTPAAKRMYIKLPKYLLFYMALGLR